MLVGCFSHADLPNEWHQCCVNGFLVAKTKQYGKTYFQKIYHWFNEFHFLPIYRCISVYHEVSFCPLKCFYISEEISIQTGKHACQYLFEVTIIWASYLFRYSSYQCFFWYLKFSPRKSYDGHIWWYAFKNKIRAKQTICSCCIL